MLKGNLALMKSVQSIIIIIPDLKSLVFLHLLFYYCQNNFIPSSEKDISHFRAFIISLLNNILYINHTNSLRSSWSIAVVGIFFHQFDLAALPWNPSEKMSYPHCDYIGEMEFDWFVLKLAYLQLRASMFIAALVVCWIQIGSSNDDDPHSWQ